MLTQSDSRGGLLRAHSQQLALAALENGRSRSVWIYTLSLGGLGRLRHRANPAPFWPVLHAKRLVLAGSKGLAAHKRNQQPTARANYQWSK